MFKEIYLPSLIADDWTLLDCSGEVPTSIELEKPENIPRITLEIPMFDASMARLNYNTGLSENKRIELELDAKKLIDEIEKVSVNQLRLKYHVKNYDTKEFRYFKKFLTDRHFKVSDICDDCDCNPWIVVYWE